MTKKKEPYGAACFSKETTGCVDEGGLNGDKGDASGIERDRWAGK